MSRGKEKIKVKTAKGRKLGSTEWLRRQLNDPLVQKAKAEGYRSRAVYKLIEIDDKYNILKPKAKIIDLGSAPGGWTQYSVKKGCDVTSIDLHDIDPVIGANFIHGDFMEEEVYNQLHGAYDAVLSDMAPHASGHKHTSHLQIMGLVEAAYDFALSFLNNGGTFVAKVFQGGGEQDLMKQMRPRFEKVKLVKPAASRKGSNEIFIVALGFKK